MDQIPSDHPSIESYRGRVARHGGGGRRVEIPDADLPTDEILRTVLDGEIRFAVIQEAGDRDHDWFAGVYDSPRLARSPSATDAYLADWLDAHDRVVGDSVHVDVIAPGYAIGLRAPGSRAVYPAIQSPTAMLSRIARSLHDP